MKARRYIAIDLKSFYASVECVARGLDPLTARLVVADPTRTDKTICLAVSPALKAFGIPGRPRLFEVNRAVARINEYRPESKRIDFIVAPPRMALYMKVSSRVYEVYLRYVAPEDIHVYSIDEVFIDATQYLEMYGLTAHDFTRKLIREVLSETGITATAGIAENLYLAKIAMDIEAKHREADADGVRIAELDEMSYRRKHWNHQPLTDFWRVGRGIAARLESIGIKTMGEIARMSLDSEEVLYKLFGVNAELLIDHAWGWEPCTMAQIKAYRPSANSISSGQVLSEPYDYEKAKVIVKEMTDSLILDLVEKGLVTPQVGLYIGYDSSDFLDRYKGATSSDYYGRKVPKPVNASIRLGRTTSSTSLIMKAMLKLFEREVNPRLHVRRVAVVAKDVVRECDADPQLDLFGPEVDTEKERRQQEAILSIRRKFGKNSILKGVDFEEGATARERNAQIGGHKA